MAQKTAIRRTLSFLLVAGCRRWEPEPVVREVARLELEPDSRELDLRLDCFCCTALLFFSAPRFTTFTALFRGC